VVDRRRVQVSAGCHAATVDETSGSIGNNGLRLPYDLRNCRIFENWFASVAANVRTWGCNVAARLSADVG
jgi:hypothetical protein